LNVELYDRMGLAYYQLRRPHEAGRWWDKAIGTYETAGLTDPLLKARIFGHRANLHFVAGEPREAIAGYEAAIAAAENVLDMPVLGGIYEGLAVSFAKTGDLTRALEYGQRSLRLFDTLRDGPDERPASEQHGRDSLDPGPHGRGRSPLPRRGGAIASGGRPRPVAASAGRGGGGRH